MEVTAIYIIAPMHLDNLAPNEQMSHPSSGPVETPALSQEGILHAALVASVPDIGPPLNATNAYGYNTCRAPNDTWTNYGIMYRSVDGVPVPIQKRTLGAPKGSRSGPEGQEKFGWPKGKKRPYVPRPNSRGNSRAAGPRPRCATCGQNHKPALPAESRNQFFPPQRH